MHTLHFILINADSAQEAASSAESEILNWGNDNNWRSIGGVASEDGTDDIDNHEGARWPLSFLGDARHCRPALRIRPGYRQFASHVGSGPGTYAHPAHPGRARRLG